MDDGIYIGSLSVIETDYGTAHSHSLRPNIPIGEYDLLAVPRSGGPSPESSDWRDATIQRLRTERNELREALELTRRNLKLAWREATK